MSYDVTVALGGEMITRQVSNLSFKSADPGGFASATLDLSRPITAESLDPFTQVQIFDAETGEQVGGGRVLDPGPGVLESGEVWSLSALGEGIAHMEDIEAPYVLIDSSYQPWHQTYSTSKKMTWSQAPQPADGSTDGLLFDIDDGATINATWKTDLRYWPILYAKKLVGGYSYRHVDGRVSSNNRVQDFASTRFGTFDIPNDTAFSGSVYVDAEVGVDFAVADARDNVFIRFTRNSSSLVATVDDWTHVEDIRISAMRLGRDRQPIVGPNAYLNNYIYAQDAVIDVWATLCPRFDVKNARVDSGTYQFDQLAWYNGVKPSGIFDDLMAAEAAFTWGVYEQQDNGLWRAEWVQRPTAVRYELDAYDGFRASDGSADLIDHVVITGQDSAGRPAVTHVYGSQPILTAAGFSRARTVDVGTDWRNTANATAIGQNIIAESILRSTSASVTVARKVLDLYTGRYVKPFHIKPGHLCRVRGVKPTQDTLNPSGSDGSSVFRIVSNSYSTDSASSSLELNSYTITEAKAIADLVRARTR